MDISSNTLLEDDVLIRVRNTLSIWTKYHIQAWELDK